MEEKEYDSSFNWKVWMKMGKFASPFRILFASVIGFNLLCALVDIVLPLFQQYAINHFIAEKTTEGLSNFAALYLVVIVFQTICVIIFTRCAMYIEMHMAKNMREACFDHLQELSFSYYNATPVGFIHSRVMSDTGRISGTLAWNLADMLWAILYVVGVFIMMLYLNWKLALLVMIVIPIMTVLTFLFQQKILNWNRKVRAAASKITSAYNEEIMGAQTSKTLVIEEKNINRFYHITDDMK
ncbi:MAG: ABC transporter transmembrane domain-containing protein, partial [Lachnospiraceae bacterium]